MKFGLVLLALASLSLAAPAPDTAEALDLGSADDGLELRSVDDAPQIRSPDDDGGDDDDDEGDFGGPPLAERELNDRDLAKRAPQRVRVNGSNVRCRSAPNLSSRVEYFVQKGEVYTTTCWSPGTTVSGWNAWFRLANVRVRGNACYVHGSLLNYVSGSPVGRC